ncbi:MAG: hypothetical protein IJT28_01650, partial [Bacteroidaceae bacterium]|nr:hypothetical protein [Bacteroidaceae bacterium]
MRFIHFTHHTRLIFSWLFVMLFCLQLNAQTIGNEKGYFCNPPLPYLPYKLDVLFIGNSFSIDTSTALPSLLRSSKLSTVAIYVLYKGGCSMKQHY